MENNMNIVIKDSMRIAEIQELAALKGITMNINDSYKVLACLAIYVDNVTPNKLRMDIDMEGFHDDYFKGHWDNWKFGRGIDV